MELLKNRYEDSPRSGRVLWQVLMKSYFHYCLMGARAFACSPDGNQVVRFAEGYHVCAVLPANTELLT
jgi:hypothetical protein